MINETERKKILARIRKCLALSKSPEPHEAAAALRQAQKLMQMYDLTERDVALAEVVTHTVTVGRMYTPAAWMVGLINVVGEAFGVKPVYERNLFESSAVIFIGVGPSADVAAYTFAVLRRKCTRARTEHYRALRGARAHRIARADAYALGWVTAVYQPVRAFAQHVPDLVHTYLAQRRANLPTLKGTDRAAGKYEHDAELGYRDGEGVALHHGVGAHAVKRIGGAS